MTGGVEHVDRHFSVYGHSGTWSIKSIMVVAGFCQVVIVACSRLLAIGSFLTVGDSIVSRRNRNGFMSGLSSNRNVIELGDEDVITMSDQQLGDN